jgi:POT family proton-dependent oligopeptide transporter
VNIEGECKKLFVPMAICYDCFIAGKEISLFSAFIILLLFLTKKIDMNITPADQAIMQTRHPKGLYVLFATEFWERFSYYGMRAIFVLFMTDKLLFDKAYASNIYGSYTGLVYLTPLLGGYVADRYWGNRKSIFVGGILMALGQFVLFACASMESGSGLATTLLWTGLAFLIFGNGFFKPNISTMVGQLYPEGDNSRKDSAYTIFYMGINAGAFVAPLVCGYLGENVDFKWGFLAAGIGMLISLVTFYYTKDKYVVSHTGEPLGTHANKLRDTSVSESGKTGFSSTQIATLIACIIGAISLLYFVVGVDIWGSAIYGMTLCLPFAILTDRSLTKIEKERMWVIVIIMLFVIFFWMCFEQAGASLTFFANEQTDHGTANNMFLVSGGLKQKGLINELPNLADLNEGDLKYNVDFKQVYATILDKWLGVDDKQILGAKYDKMKFI